MATKRTRSENSDTVAEKSDDGNNFVINAFENEFIVNLTIEHDDFCSADSKKELKNKLKELEQKFQSLETKCGKQYEELSAFYSLPISHTAMNIFREEILHEVNVASI